MTPKRWLPPQTDLPASRLLLAAAFALISIAAVAWVTHHALQDLAAPFLVASMGAAAVLLYVVPTSPMSTPWAFIGGHFVSAGIAITLYRLLPDPLLAAPLAIALALLAMYLLRCIHPPGGAAALLTVVGGEGIHQLGYQFLLTPLAINLTFMLASYLAYRRLLRHLDERTRLLDPIPIRDIPRSPLPFQEQDLERALAEMGSFIDVTHEDLKRIYLRAQAHALLRHSHGQTAAELAGAPISVEFATPLSEVWRHFQQHPRLAALPVVDRADRVLGLISRDAFLKAAEHWGEGDLRRGLQCLCRPSGTLESDCPEVAGQLMDKNAPTLPADTPALQALEALHDSPYPVLPVVDHCNRLTGLITHSPDTPHTPVDAPGEKI